MSLKESKELHRISSAPFTPKASRGPFRMGGICTTEVCNLACVFCHFNGPQATKKSKELPAELVAKAMNDLTPKSLVYFAATGEFFMDEHAIENLEAAIQRDLKPMVLTHGQLLTTELLDKVLSIGVRDIRISCDAIEPHAYAKIRRGGELRHILDAVTYLREKRAIHPDIRVEINCTLLSNSFDDQERMIAFWRGKVDGVNFNAEYFDTFRYRNIHFMPEKRVDCQLQTYVLPSGKIAPCCAVMVYAHDNDVSWLPDIRTHTLQEAYDESCDMYEDPKSELSALCRKCDWWIMWAKRPGGGTPYLRCVSLDETPISVAPAPSLLAQAKKGLRDVVIRIKEVV
jgi:MoaA/NifB/PqqE/SkfB family radical SAM enzyme